MNIVGGLGELKITLCIERKETGKKEYVELIGTLGETDGGNTFNSGAECGDGCSNGADRNLR